MNNIPHISVIMPVYNCAEYVSESIQSILNQTYTDFEFLIIDDYSTDSTLEIVKSFEDERIRVYEKTINRGMVDSLNFGISKAKGSLIARMDGDDISHLTRFAKQLKILEDNPDIDIVSANAQIPGTKLVYNYSFAPEQVKVDLLFGSAFVHASLMGKINVFKENPFDEKMKHAEDYDMWTRLAFKAKMSNMSEILYDYRAHGNQVSNKFNKMQRDNCAICQYRMFHYISYDKNVFSDNLLDKALRKFPVENPLETIIILKWFKEIININKDQELFDIQRFNKAVKLFRKKFIKFSLQAIFNKNVPFSAVQLYVLLKEDPNYLIDTIKNKISKKLTY